jgi:hypothetical protein
MHAECCLVNVIWVHAHQVISTMEVKLGELPRIVAFVQQFIDHRDQKLVLHCLLVQLMMSIGNRHVPSICPIWS